MVQLSALMRRSNSNFKELRNQLKHKFIDSLQVTVKGGPGGSGYPKYGGIGGNGGNVYVHAKAGNTLKGVLRSFPTKLITASTGKNSQKNCIYGENGENKIIYVPTGVAVYDKKRRLLGELNEEGSSILVAKGGLGGCRETGYGAMKGESDFITLDLKLIADVGFVGFPNAGKSTLLAALSRAKPKIASYPFTTIKPNIGVMEFKDGRQISLADLPGLIEGAHLNIGMGHRFLRHVERTRLLLLMVDINGFQLSPKHVARTCLENIVLLNKELELYSEDLLFKPTVLIVNKMDTENANEIYKEVEEKIHNLQESSKMFPEEMRSKNVLQFDSVLPISAKNDSKEAMNKLKEEIRTVIDKYAMPYDSENELNLAEELAAKTKEQVQMVT